MQSYRAFLPRFISCARCVPCLAILAFVLFPALAGAATIGPGYSGMWYDPARSGEGLQLEILDANRATVYWFTYDDQGRQRWFGGIGQITHDATGDSIRFPQMYITHGGRFGPSFDPDDVQFQTEGTVSLSFGDCNNGTFKYTAFGQSQTLPIQRLTQTMGAGCAPINGVPGEPVMVYAGQSGNWYDTSRSGEGFDLQWMANGQAIVSWYTYDTQGNQAWVMGVGAEQNGAIVFDNLFTTSGPKFGTAFDTTQYQEKAWGTLTLTLDCNGGTAHYASTLPGFGSGDFTLTRLTALQKPACPYVKPRLSDLYDITWDEIPVPVYTLPSPTIILGESIANDGTIAGRQNGDLALWHPDSQTWEHIPQQRLATGLPLFISPDGSSVIASDDFTADTSHVVLWRRSTGWQALPGNIFDKSWLYGISHDFNYMVGGGRNGQNPREDPWVGAVNGIRQQLPLTTAIPGGTPWAVSDDGKTVVGVTWRFPDGRPTPVAIRWDNGGEPVTIRNPAGEELGAANACNADCSIVYGNGLYNYDINNLQTLEGWYLTSDGAFEYMGALADSIGYGVTRTTPDGSIAIGVYQAYAPDNYPALTVTRAFIWTEATGIVSVRSLVSELGIGDDDWDEITRESISPDGLKILMGGGRRLDKHPLSQTRVVVLRLVPIVAPN